MNVDIILQARSTSTRLPEKIYKPLRNKPMLEQIIIRLQKVSNIRHLCIATTEKDIKKIQHLLSHYNCPVFSGSEDNVLDRFVKVGNQLKTDIMVRTTADNPFVDYVHLEKGIELFMQNQWDYFGYQGLPYGAGFEIFKFSALQKAYKKTKNKFDLEHVTPYIYNHTDEFCVFYKEIEADFYCPSLRVTVDTMADYEQAKKWYELYWDNTLNVVDLGRMIKNECVEKN